MALATTYSEVHPTLDTDVALFIAMHPLGAVAVRCNIKKAWVAREGDAIVGVLVLRSEPFVALNYLPADADARTFMRLWKLWQMAEWWLMENGIPVVCVDVHNSQLHFQSLLRRLKFEAVGSSDVLDTTVYAKRVLEAMRAA